MALPIWHGYILGEGTTFLHEIGLSKKEFTAALYSQDVLIREWAMDVRDVYQSIRNHPDPRVQEVWVQFGSRGFEEFERPPRNTKTLASWINKIPLEIPSIPSISLQKRGCFTAGVKNGHIKDKRSLSRVPRNSFPLGRMLDSIGVVVGASSLLSILATISHLLLFANF